MVFDFLEVCFCRVKVCFCYEVGVGYLFYLNLVKLCLSESFLVLGGDGLVLDKNLYDFFFKEVLFEFCVVFIWVFGGKFYCGIFCFKFF